MSLIESLELEVTSSSDSAARGIEALAATLEKLKAAARGGSGLEKQAASIQKLNATLSQARNTAGAVDVLAASLKSLSAVSNVKISASIANQLSAITKAAGGLSSDAGTNIRGVAQALGTLATVPKGNIGSIVTAIEKIPNAFAGLANTNIAGISSQMQSLVTALKPLSEVADARGFDNAVKSLAKIPKLTNDLNPQVVSQFGAAVRSIADSLEPLAARLDRVGTAFSRLPSQMRQVSNAANSVTRANQQANNAYLGQGLRIAGLYASLRMVGTRLAKFINESNRYVEDMNLFNVAMGEYAASAQRYAKRVSEVMGIDPAEWMRNQGIFQTLATGFGVAADRAAIMSKNLTQLGYDLSSFFNISAGDAMQKLQSGISGELEPLNLAA